MIYDTDKLIECSTPSFTPVSVSHYYSTIVKDKRPHKNWQVRLWGDCKSSSSSARAVTATFKKINKVVYTQWYCRYYYFVVVLNNMVNNIVCSANLSFSLNSSLLAINFLPPQSESTLSSSGPAPGHWLPSSSCSEKWSQFYLRINIMLHA